jgi:hypothetical protein
MIAYEYKVYEVADSKIDEPGVDIFGYHWFRSQPQIGDKVMLKWLSGDDAYEVVVLRVWHERLEIEVKKT